MNNTTEAIKAALDQGNLPEAQTLLREALKNPTAEIYCLAARAAVNDGQRRSFLEKAIELDPFNETAHTELNRLQSTTIVPVTPVSQPTGPQPVNYALVQPQSVYAPPTPRKRLNWLWIAGPIALVLIVLVVGGILLANSSHGISLAAEPTITPRPTLTPTPMPVVLAKTVNYDSCTLPSVTSVTYRKGPVIQACVTPKEVGQYENVTLIGRLLVDGKPQSYTTMYSYWNYYFFPASYSNTTDSEGLAKIRVNTGIVTVGYPVIVDVAFNYSGQKIILDTSKTGPTTFLPVS